MRKPLQTLIIIGIIILVICRLFKGAENLIEWLKN
jgi:hypothetical protein